MTDTATPIVADHMTDHAYQELASALEAPTRVADRTTSFE